MATKADEQRLAALRDLLIEVQFVHPDLRAQRVDAFYAARSDLARRVRRIHLYALERRTFWANHDDTAINAARAVAYQSVAGMLQRALEGSPSVAAPDESPVGEWIG